MVNSSPELCCVIHSTHSQSVHEPTCSTTARAGRSVSESLSMDKFMVEPGFWRGAVNGE